MGLNKIADIFNWFEIFHNLNSVANLPVQGTAAGTSQKQVPSQAKASEPRGRQRKATTSTTSCSFNTSTPPPPGQLTAGGANGKKKRCTDGEGKGKYSKKPQRITPTNVLATEKETTPTTKSKTTSTTTIKEPKANKNYQEHPSTNNAISKTIPMLSTTTAEMRITKEAPRKRQKGSICRLSDSESDTEPQSQPLPSSRGTQSGEGSAFNTSKTALNAVPLSQLFSFPEWTSAPATRAIQSGSTAPPFAKLSTSVTSATATAAHPLLCTSADSPVAVACAHAIPAIVTGAPASNPPEAESEAGGIKGSDESHDVETALRAARSCERTSRYFSFSVLQYYSITVLHCVNVSRVGRLTTCL